MDLTAARDRLADHIKVLSDELGDREVMSTDSFHRICQLKLLDQSREIID